MLLKLLCNISIMQLGEKIVSHKSTQLLVLSYKLFLQKIMIQCGHNIKIKRKKLNFTCILFTPALQKYLLISKSISQFPTKLKQKRKYVFHFHFTLQYTISSICTVMAEYFLSQYRKSNIYQSQNYIPFKTSTLSRKSHKLTHRYIIIPRSLHKRKCSNILTFGK